MNDGEIIPLEKPLIWPLGKAAGIAYVDNVFEESFCQNLIKFCQDNEDRSFYGKTSGGVQLHIKVSQDWHLTQSGPIPTTPEEEFDKRIFNQLWRVLMLYKKSIPQLDLPWSSPYSMANDTGYQIQKYAQCSGYYSEHVDGAPFFAYSSNRVLGVVICLNTVEVGGGTHFPMHQTEIAAVAGRVAMFPANWTHPHCGTMPYSSDKWIVSTFVCSVMDNANPHVCTEECVSGDQEVQNAQ